MGYDAKTERLISLKKLAGKAQTSNDKGLSNEALPSGLTLSSDTVFGQSISTSPASAALYDITSTVEYIRFECSFIAGSDTSDGRHGFELKLPSDYEANSSNPSAGTYPYIDSQIINITSGALQLVPTSFATPYEGKPFYDGTSAKDSGTQIPILDARDWYLDYFNGVFFQQDPPGTGDHANNPDFLEAYLYIGQYLSTVVSNAGGGSGDANAQYLVLSATGSLSAERVWTDGTGISTTDSGAGAAFTVAIDNSIVATLTGSQFSGNVGVTGSIGSTTVITSPAFSGSLTHLQDGTSYLKAGNNVTITSASNGSITIASTSTTYTAGDGLDLSGTEFSVDLKSSGGLEIDSTELAIDDSVVATISGSTFTGAVKFNSGLSGSLTHLTDGTSYIKEGTNVTVTTASNGSITIASTDTTYTAGDGLDLSGTEFSVDLKSAGGLKIDSTELAIDNSVVATLTGSQFTGNVDVTGSFLVKSGDFTVESTGEDQALFLDASTNTFYINKGSTGFTTVIKNTNNEVFRAGAGGAIFNEYGNKFIDFRIESWNKPYALFIDSQTDQVLILSGGGATSTDESTYTDLNFFVSGSIGSRDTSTKGISLFGGDLLTSGSAIALSGLSGSLQQLSDGTSYLREGSNITITSASDGSVMIASTGGGGTGDANPEYLVSALSGSIPNAKLVEAGTGITITTGSNSFTITADASSVTGRNKQTYVLTSSHSEDSDFFVSFTNFSDVTFNKNLIDIYLNGQMLHSGTQAQVAALTADYAVITSGSLRFAFDLRTDDQVDAIISQLDSSSGGGGDSGAQYLVLAATGSLSAERVLTAGSGISLVDAGPGNSLTISSTNYFSSPSSGFLNATGSTSFAGTLGSAYIASSIGSDSFFFVSGSIGSRDSLTRGTAVFGGDLVVSGTITGITGLSGSIDRSKKSYFLSSDHTARSTVSVTNSDFSKANYDLELIDVLVNGQMLHSGTQSQIVAATRDYYVTGTSSLKFSFDLKIDDVIDVVVYNVKS